MPPIIDGCPAQGSLASLRDDPPDTENVVNRPDLSWRPTAKQATATVFALVCLGVGFAIGWQHRTTLNPQSITPRVPANMRQLTATTGMGTRSTSTAALPLRAQVHIGIVNTTTVANSTIQLAVAIVQAGYPTPITTSLTIDVSQLPTITTMTTVPIGNTTGTGTDTTSQAGTTPASTTTLPQSVTSIPITTVISPVVFYRPGNQAVAQRLANDIGIQTVLAAPTTGPLATALRSAAILIVVSR